MVEFGDIDFFGEPALRLAKIEFSASYNFGASLVFLGESLLAPALVSKKEEHLLTFFPLGESVTLVLCSPMSPLISRRKAYKLQLFWKMLMAIYALASFFMTKSLKDLPSSGEMTSYYFNMVVSTRHLTMAPPVIWAYFVCQISSSILSMSVKSNSSLISISIY